MYLISIVGPTAIGKTALAIELAKKYNAEIISADSRQFYKEISIGTAKPSNEELAAVPHHFINNKSINETYSAGDFERDALKKLNELFAKNKVVIMVGGSGLYVKALWEGLDEMPKIDETLRKDIIELYEKEGIEALQQKLKLLSPEKFETIDIQNPQRLMRAIEIASLSKTLIDEYAKKAKASRNFINIKIGLTTNRDHLYNKINIRVDDMFNKGLLFECQSVFDYKNHYSLQTVGYTEIFDFFDGKHELDKAVDLIKQHTRNYAKRQLTWFNRDPEIAWFEPYESKEILSHIKTLIKL